MIGDGPARRRHPPRPRSGSPTGDFVRYCPVREGMPGPTSGRRCGPAGGRSVAAGGRGGPASRVRVGLRLAPEVCCSARAGGGRDRGRQLGLPYAGALVERLTRHLGDTVAAGAAAGPPAVVPPDIAELPPELQTTISSLAARASIPNAGCDAGQPGADSPLQDAARSSAPRAAVWSAEGVRTFVQDVLEPLHDAIREARRSSSRRRPLRSPTTGWPGWPPTSTRPGPPTRDSPGAAALRRGQQRGAADHVAPVPGPAQRRPAGLG